MREPRWTLDELAERVDTALAVDYSGPPSGRVRAVPDRRAIRWYTTIGLIDRPVAHRGRTALYGPRHLLQLVAVKRLQARGLPLVAIQQELAGATDSQLARVARLPEGVAPGPAVSASHGDGLSGTGQAGSGTAAAAPATRGKVRRAGFWRERPAAFTVAADAATLTDPTDPVGPAGPATATLRGVRLGDGATLLLEPGRELGAEDVRAVLEAAGPLLAALRERGLGPGAEEPDQDPSARRLGPEPRREHP
ncbi:MAG TPA: MerR family transcriptional regulator [Actinomycetes bacterium]|jgi:DNA-binding transcriptional MerR regulator|nr:MerR family transcriptional regulator [Actinomycetes bacterium]